MLAERKSIEARCLRDFLWRGLHFSLMPLGSELFAMTFGDVLFVDRFAATVCDRLNASLQIIHRYSPFQGGNSVRSDSKLTRVFRNNCRNPVVCSGVVRV